MSRKRSPKCCRWSGPRRTNMKPKTNPVREAAIGGLMCAGVFAMPLLLCWGTKLVLISVVGMPLGWVVGGLLGYLRCPSDRDEPGSPDA